MYDECNRCARSVRGIPKTNCRYCWHRYFSNHYGTVEVARSFLKNGMSSALIAAYGDKWYKEFRKYIGE